MAFQAGTPTCDDLSGRLFKVETAAFRPNGARHVSLGQVNPRMRMNAAPGSLYTPEHCPERATQIRALPFQGVWFLLNCQPRAFALG